MIEKQTINKILRFLQFRVKTSKIVEIVKILKNTLKIHYQYITSCVFTILQLLLQFIALQTANYKIIIAKKQNCKNSKRFWQLCV